ncbi:hypothetical protein [uncultured Modestobacter sp.]|uniref:hypothetical protein n=1 Tax=uncultured Modestobacter sp. TaxID=380048 RepID=UPI0026101D3E|nr:hypothetical protein [uncultured Modestobacter sp.]
MVALAAVASLWLGASAAGAAPTNPTTTLTPESVESNLRPSQNYGPLPVQSPLPGSGFETIPVAWGGAVTVTLPPQVAPAGPTPGASLDLVGADGITPTRTYSTGAAAPADLLVVTDLGSGTYRIDMPADDGANGPTGRLALTDLASTLGSWSTFVDPALWTLEFSAAAPAAVTLTSQVVTSSAVGCQYSDLELPACSSVQVTAGTSMDVVLPASSHLTELGIPDLGVSDFSLNDFLSTDLIEGMSLPLESTLSADRRTATMEVPDSTEPGRYLLVSVAGDGAGQVVSGTYSVIEVIAPAVNPGLRSETGGDAGTPALLPITLGSLVALAGAGVVVRSRRSAARA